MSTGAPLIWRTIAFGSRAHDGLIVPLVGHGPRLKQARALAGNVALYFCGHALVHFARDRAGRGIGPSRAAEVYLTATRKDRKLGAIVREELTTELIEMHSTADHPLYLPAGWELAKMQRWHFVPRRPLRLLAGQRRVAVNVLGASRAGRVRRDAAR